MDVAIPCRVPVRAIATGRDGKETAELASAESVAKFAIGSVEPEGVTRRDMRAGGVVEEPVDGLRTQGEGLFDEDVASAIERLYGEVDVLGGVRGDRDAVGAALVE
jgi:hypothetical protein